MLGFKAFALLTLAAFGANAIPIGGADTSALSGALEAAGVHLNTATGNNSPIPRDLPLGGVPVPGADGLLGTVTGAVGGAALPGLRRDEVVPSPAGGAISSIEDLKTHLKS